MSLATTGGGGFAGGGGGGMGGMAMMAHGGPNAAAVAAHIPTHTAHQIPGGSSGGGGMAGTGYMALGADLLDKNQNLTGKGVRNSASMPIVAIDLYGDECGVAYFPPTQSVKADTTNDQDGGEEKKDEPSLKSGMLARSVVTSANNGGDLVLLRDDGIAKAIRRFLNKGEGHATVINDAIMSFNASISDAKEKEGGGHAIVIPRPHLVLGARKVNELNDAACSAYASLLPLTTSKKGDKNKNKDEVVIDQDDDIDEKLGLGLTTINMDGNTSPKNDDYDRVAYRLRLNSKKKVMTMLPEEAVALVILGCKKATYEEWHGAPTKEYNGGAVTIKDDDDNNDEGEGGYDEYCDYPPAFAIPGWAATDATLTGLIEACSNGNNACGPALHQRSVAAVVGALVPPRPDAGMRKARNGRAIIDPNVDNTKIQPSSLHRLLEEITSSKDDQAQSDFQKRLLMTRVEDRGNSLPEPPSPFVPMIVMVGATKFGIEITAMLISKPQDDWPKMELHCPYGNISVISSICHATPISTKYEYDDHLSAQLQSTMEELRAQVGLIAPESEEPTAFVTYGTSAMQTKLSKGLKTILELYGEKGDDDDNFDGWDDDIPILSTTEDCVPLGLAVLAASVHGRVRLAVIERGKDDKNRTKAKLAVAVQDVSPCAVAVSFNYFGKSNDDDNTHWTDPKVIFDFDRRVPAGPYQIDITAAECAAHVKYCTDNRKKFKFIDDESALIDMADALRGSKGIPEREDAALQLRFRVYQKASRTGDWIRVGEDMKPLTIKHSQKDEGSDRVAIESTVFEISLNSVGMLTTKFITNGETIVQATKSARNSKLLRWGSIIGAVSFMGFFMIKSYVDERIFDRDTERVLNFYRRAAKNSMHDGDVHGARYLVWKYKGKKNKLWRRLEVKYNIPVKHSWEWDDDEECTLRQYNAIGKYDFVCEGGEKNDKEEEDDTEDLDSAPKDEKLKDDDRDEL